jgi:hypothetical protein
MTKNADISNSNSILRNILIILIVAGIAYLIYYLYANNAKSSNVQVPVQQMKVSPPVATESFKQVRQESEEQSRINNVKHNIEGRASGLENPVMNKTSMLPKGNVVGENAMEHFSQDPSYGVERNLTSFPKEQLTAQDLLPQDNSSLWAQVNPAGEGSLKDRSFLQAGYNIGINTVGQTLRNANLQLRSEPPCPQVKISPWLQSTISPDVSRKPFEIGGCA